MSLTLLNEDKGEDPEGDPERYLLVPARVCTAVRAGFGSEALKRFYDALWADAEAGDGDWIGALERALRAAGLPAELARAGATEEFDAELRRSHSAAVSLVPGDVGTPIISVADPDGRRFAFFGPVLDAPPDGEAAGRLWDGLLLVAGTSGFRELKGPVLD